MKKRAVIVCQTPFQFYNAIVISKLISIPIDLWLIDIHMEEYDIVAKQERIWQSVYTASRETKGSKFRFFSSILKHQNRIKKYLKEIQPSIIYVFADNNELCATFVSYGKKISDSSIILVEEGTTVYSSPFRIKADLHKFILRKILGIQNPRGYMIGWSKNIDKIVVSNKELIHAEYLKDRKVIEWPKTKFPKFAADVFLKKIDLKSKIPEGGVLYLGQPIVEMGVFPIKLERELFLALNGIEKEKILVKLHPFEREDKYKSFHNLSYFPKEFKFIPVEVLFDIIQPKMVISYFSGAGINFSLRNQKDSIFYLPDILPDTYKDFIIKNFSNIHNIHIAEDLLALKKIITLISNNDELKKKERGEDLAEWKIMINQTITL